MTVALVYSTLLCATPASQTISCNLAANWVSYQIHIVCRTKADKSLIELKQVRGPFFPARNSKLTRIIRSKFESPNPN
jgi:hypothetical protein